MENLSLTILFLLCVTALSGQGNCSISENFNQYQEGDMISQESFEWSIVDPGVNADGIIRSDGLGGNNSDYLHILEGGEVGDPTFVQYDFNNLNGMNISLSFDMLKNINAGAVLPSGAKFFLEFGYGNTAGNIGFFYEDNDDLTITFLSQTIEVNEFTLGWDTWSFEFANGDFDIFRDGNFIGQFDVPANIIEFRHIEFCGNNGQFWLDNFCLKTSAGFNCGAAETLLCNDSGNDVYVGSNNPNQNSDATDLIDLHPDCSNADDGCDGGNEYNGGSTNGYEAIYTGSAFTNGNLVIDLHWSNDNDNLELFAYDNCSNSDGVFNCLSSSTYSGTNFESLVIENASSFNDYYFVVDGRQNSDMSDYIISMTCGELEDHDKQMLECGIPVIGNTEDSENLNSFYCNCQFQTRNDGRQNYGPEDVYEFTLEESVALSIILEIEDPDVDLNLYLLDDCDIADCNRASDSDSAGETELIEFSGSSSNMLPAGTYTVVVEGYRGDAGGYTLTLLTEACADPCAYNRELSCERFEKFADGDEINDDDNWNQGVNGTISCKVRETGGNHYLAIDQENFEVCASTYTLPANTQGDEIEHLRFDVYIPFSEGFSFFLNEVDPDDVIFFNFSDFFGGGSTNINYRVNDSAESQNGDYEPFDYPYDEWFSVEITLDKASREMIVFIADQLLFNVDDSGVEDLMDISFDANLSNQSGNGEATRVDNICQDVCGETPFMDPCDYLTELYCDRFEQSANGDNVRDLDNWEATFLAGDLFVQSEDNGNRFISVQDDGPDEAGVLFNFPTNNQPGQIEVFSFKAWIPEEGGLSTLYEAVNGQTMFLDLIESDLDGPTVNFGITDVFYSGDLNNGYVPAPYQASTWFEVQFNLNRDNQAMEVFFDGALVFSITNTGFEAFKSTEFLSVLSNDKESRVDDVCISNCGMCALPWEEEPDCNKIVIVESEISGSDLNLSLDAISSLDIIEWETVNLNNGDITTYNTTESNIEITIPVGVPHEICVFYTNSDGCVIRCCLPVSTATYDGEVEGLEIFPNPTNSLLHVRKDDTSEINFSVSNVNGVVVSRGALRSLDSTIDMSEFHDGIYMLEIIDNQKNQRSIQKLVKY